MIAFISQLCIRKNIFCCAIHVLQMCLHLAFLSWGGNCLYNPNHCLSVQRVCQRLQILWVCPEGAYVCMFMSKAIVCVLREALCSWPCLKITVGMSYGWYFAHGHVSNHRLHVLRVVCFISEVLVIFDMLHAMSDKNIHKLKVLMKFIFPNYFFN